ncbi:MAG: AMP-binding protein [Candidatus Omnitrophica bacterium]|nr:AMP-binding protein [Candidatus Omnitrophota bacterium]MCB9719766.1 AMP-binding protein [Candidatus Omnitrophota bacterium]
MSQTDRHIFARFEQTARACPDEECIRFKTSDTYCSLSYKTLRRRVLLLREILLARGVRPGDRVAIIAENHPTFVAAMLAILAADAIAVPLDIQYTSQQLQTVIDHAGIKIILGVSRTFSEWNNGVRDAETVQMDAGNIMREFAEIDEPRGFDPAATHTTEALILYTSGTTSEPKGVVLTHENILANVDALLQKDIIRTEDRVLSFLPLHHAYAISGTLFTPLLSGAKIIFPASIAAKELVACMRETKTTIFVGVPQVYSLMHRTISDKLNQLPAGRKFMARTLGRLSAGWRRITGINASPRIFGKIHATYGGHLRLMVSGGAHLDEQIAADFSFWGFTIVQGYGLTETAPVLTFDSPRAPRIGSSGQPLCNVAIKIHAPGKDGIGEVWAKGPNVMAGYFRNPEATAAVMKGEWFKTGDLGYLDRAGRLYLKGRKKELIVLSSGKNIHPEQLEKQFDQMPSIKEAAVLTARTGHDGSEQLVGLFVPDEAFFAQQRDMGIVERIKWDLENIQAQLPSYQHLRGFEVIQEPLPRTRLGKIRRFQLVRIFEEARREHLSRQRVTARVSSAAHSGLESRALAFLEETLKQPVQRSDHLELDLGVDSLGRIELLMNLQEHLGLKINEEQMMKFFSCTTVGELEETLRGVQGAAGQVAADPDAAREWSELLQGDPPPQVRERVALTFSTGQIIFNFFMIAVFKLFFGFFFLLTATGRWNLPRKGPYILASNHASYLDGLFVMSALPYRTILRTYFIGLGKFLDAPLLKPFGKVARLVPVYKDFSLIDTLRSCAYLLRHGKVLCYFPAGQRSIDGSVQPFKKGIGILIKELDVPVVPVYIEGSFKTWPRGRRFPRLASVSVRFGKALRPADFEIIMPGEGRDPHQHIADQLREQVRALVRGPAAPPSSS